MKANELVPGRKYVYTGRGGRELPLCFECEKEVGRIYVFRFCGPKVGTMMVGRPMVEEKIREDETWTRTN